MKAVAVLGAAADHSKFGNKAVRAFRAQGYAVDPINPKETAIERFPCFKSIAGVSVRPQMVSVYLLPDVRWKLVPEVAAKGCDDLWLSHGTVSDGVLFAAARIGLQVVQARAASASRRTKTLLRNFRQGRC